MTPNSILLAALAALAPLAVPARADPGLGLFSSQQDVGSVVPPGSASYDAGAGTYTLSSSGANMWFKEDDMHFVWAKATGDMAIAADIAFLGTSAQGHRKACLVIRQNLTSGSPYADVAQHGDGLTSLQYRLVQDGPTQEIRSLVRGPARVRLDKLGDSIYLSVARAGEEPRPSGASIRLPLAGAYYVGLALSAHDAKATERAVFSKVEIGPASPAAAEAQPNLTIITLPSGDRSVKER
jgi:hypothetical protein